ncbi:MAG: class I SAM-dependent methyltransferase [Actinomycetota bacterium]|nr:class I SAM-dependent methyltransferase [Actinomycetota bacterium]
MDERIASHYELGVELDRLAGPTSRIEFASTQELLERFLPPPTAAVLDVGGGPGAYAAWLAERGYDVHLVDPVELHVEQARARGGFTAELGDARRLANEDASVDVVLLLGPLYHLTERDDRLLALAEARRVVRPGGLVAVAAISRFASLLDGLLSGHLGDAAFRAVVERDLGDGQHRNPDGRVEWFTTAFFHHPDELRAELVEARLALEGLFGVEGPGWLLAHLWDDPARRDDVLFAARAVETEPS